MHSVIPIFVALLAMVFLTSVILHYGQRLGDRLWSEENADRGQVQLVDAVLGLFVLVAILSLSPVLFTFIGWVRASGDPFSALLLGLVVPLLLLALILSMGVSARRGA